MFVEDMCNIVTCGSEIWIEVESDNRIPIDQKNVESLGDLGRRTNKYSVEMRGKVYY